MRVYRVWITRVSRGTLGGRAFDRLSFYPSVLFTGLRWTSTASNFGEVPH